MPHKHVAVKGPIQDGALFDLPLPPPVHKTRLWPSGARLTGVSLLDEHAFEKSVSDSTGTLSKSRSSTGGSESNNWVMPLGNMSLFGDAWDDDGGSSSNPMPPVTIPVTRTPVDPNVTPERTKTRELIHYTPQRLSLTLPTGSPDRRINGGEGVVRLYPSTGSAIKTGDGIVKEGLAIESIDSPHVVKGKLIDDELLMPLAHGDLLSYVSHISTFISTSTNEPLKELMFLTIAGSIVDGAKHIQIATESAVCDIKPENILVVQTHTLLMADLGSLVSVGSSKTAGYTPRYAPPEFFPSTIKDNVDMTDVPVGSYSDVYSIAATLFRVVFNKNYFDTLATKPKVLDNPLHYEGMFMPGPVQQIQEAVQTRIKPFPEPLATHLKEIVLKGLSIDPNDRPHLSQLQIYIFNAIKAILDKKPEIVSELKDLWVGFTMANQSR